MDINAKLAEVAVEFRDIENGHLVSNYIGYETLIFPMALFYSTYKFMQAQEHHEKALKGLLKRCRSGTEEFMRLLENLDAMRSVNKEKAT